MENNSENIIIDSNMSREEVLVQNPERVAPQDIIDSIEILSVKYFGFDERLHSGQIAMNKRVIEDVKKFFDLALEMKFPIEKVIPISNLKYKWDDVLSCGDNNSSGYNYRLITASNKISKHAVGVAFDINPVQNIYVKYDENQKEVFRFPNEGVYDVNVKGTLIADNPLVKLLKGLGWEWGGDWTAETGREDYQHFEKNI